MKFIKYFLIIFIALGVPVELLSAPTTKYVKKAAKVAWYTAQIYSAVRIGKKWLYGCYLRNLKLHDYLTFELGPFQCAWSIATALLLVQGCS